MIIFNCWLNLNILTYLDGDKELQALQQNIMHSNVEVDQKNSHEVNNVETYVHPHIFSYHETILGERFRAS